MKTVRTLASILVISTFFSSCMSRYFEPLPPPPHPVRIDIFKEMAGKNLWYGIVFNGEKVGFSRFSLSPLPASQDFLLQGETHMNIRFLGLNRRVQLKYADTIRRDLTLKSFYYYQRIDGGELEITGSSEGEAINVSVKSQQIKEDSVLPVKGKVYPASIVNLYPVFFGLSLGKQYRYSIFEPQTVHIYEVEQKVVSYEKAPHLGLPPTFRLETEMEGFRATTWINASGETEMERGLTGVLISYREGEEEARKYLVEASLAKKDLAADFSLVKTDRPITCPRRAKSLTAVISGLKGQLELPVGPTQQARKEKDSFLIYTDPALWVETNHLTDDLRRWYVSSHPQIEAHHREVRETAQTITRAIKDKKGQVVALTRWVAREIAHELVEGFSALEVLKSRKGECQAHTLLYTALARSLGIPTRLVGGLVYVEGQGFLYHSWAESYVDGWLPVDPTFGQVPIDATHIKLVEGPDWSAFLPLSKVMGQIKIEVLNYTCHEER